MNWICPRSDEKNTVSKQHAVTILNYDVKHFWRIIQWCKSYKNALQNAALSFHSLWSLNFAASSHLRFAALSKKKNHLKRFVNDKHIVKEKRKRGRRKEKLFTVQYFILAKYWQLRRHFEGLFYSSVFH